MIGRVARDHPLRQQLLHYKQGLLPDSLGVYAQVFYSLGNREKSYKIFRVTE